MRNEKGFTMIELVVVIVILGILAAVAVPKFVDMKTEAEVSAAKGVYGAAQAASALNHAAKLVGKSVTMITDAATLVGAMEGLPDGWIQNGTAICVDSDASATCVDANDSYVVRVTTGETATAKAVVAKAGTATW